MPDKTALIGIPPRSHAQGWLRQGFFYDRQVSAGELLLSSRALAPQCRPLQGQKKEKASHTREGMYFYTRDKPGVDKRFKEYFAQQTKGKPQCLNPASQDFNASHAAGPDQSWFKWFAAFNKACKSA